MAGRNPAEAFENFIAPVERAISTLGPAKITLSPRGRSAPDLDHVWTLNGTNGFVAKHGWHFEAFMNYRIVRSEGDAGPWKITTTGYRYRLALTGQDLFRLHWHPIGKSHVDFPHLHAAIATGSPAESLDAHLETDRMSLERALAWAFELGLPAARKDWREVLEDCERPHLEHRSWGSKADLAARRAARET